MDDNTITITIENLEYTLKRRLGWADQQRIEERSFSLFVDGQRFQAADGDLSEIGDLEIRMNTVAETTERLQARLVSTLDLTDESAKPRTVRRRDIPDLDPAHVAVLIARIVELENEEKALVEALMEGNPTGQS